MASKIVTPGLSLSSLLLASVQVAVRNICGDKSPGHPPPHPHPRVWDPPHISVIWEKLKPSLSGVSMVMMPCGR
jgi:hypothetical protein